MKLVKLCRNAKPVTLLQLQLDLLLDIVLCINFVQSHLYTVHSLFVLLLAHISKVSRIIKAVRVIIIVIRIIPGSGMIMMLKTFLFSARCVR